MNGGWIITEFGEIYVPGETQLQKESYANWLRNHKGYFIISLKSPIVKKLIRDNTFCFSDILLIYGELQPYGCECIPWHNISHKIEYSHVLLMEHIRYIIPLFNYYCQSINNGLGAIMAGVMVTLNSKLISINDYYFRFYQQKPRKIRVMMEYMFIELLHIIEYEGKNIDTMPEIWNRYSNNVKKFKEIINNFPFYCISKIPNYGYNIDIKCNLSEMLEMLFFDENSYNINLINSITTLIFHLDILNKINKRPSLNEIKKLAPAILYQPDSSWIKPKYWPEKLTVKNIPVAYQYLFEECGNNVNREKLILIAKEFDLNVDKLSNEKICDILRKHVELLLN